jgi:hypothetical protein
MAVRRKPSAPSDRHAQIRADPWRTSPPLLAGVILPEDGRRGGAISTANTGESLRGDIEQDYRDVSFVIAVLSTAASSSSDPPFCRNKRTLLFECPLMTLAV